MITLRNDFHNSTVRLHAQLGDELTPAQIKRAKNTLCGISGCACGGALGQRGRQRQEDGRFVGVVFLGYNTDGDERISITEY